MILMIHSCFGIEKNRPTEQSPRLRRLPGVSQATQLTANQEIPAESALLSEKISPAEDTFIVDSFPIEVCRFARAKRVRICKENFDTAPDYGYCAAQKNTYFGYKLHGLCGVSGVFKKIDLSKASIADIHYLQDIREDILPCILLGDKAYLSAEIQLDLFQTQGVRLVTPKRRNQKILKNIHRFLESSESALKLSSRNSVTNS